MYNYGEDLNSHYFTEYNTIAPRKRDSRSCIIDPNGGNFSTQKNQPQNKNHSQSLSPDSKVSLPI